MISHLLNADDTLLFFWIEGHTTPFFKRLLQCYCDLLVGQAINFSKLSIIFNPNTPIEIRDIFISTLGVW